MTGPDNSNTRPISVAELLAKNGTIGAPPAGGRRRRRRGNADAVTVAELTGEIPIIADRTGAIPVVEPEPPAADPDAVEPSVEQAATAAPDAPEAPADAPDATEIPEDAVAADVAGEDVVVGSDLSEQDAAVADDVDAAEIPPVDDSTDTVTEDDVQGDPEDTAEADYAAHLQARAAADAPVDFKPRRRRPWSFPAPREQAAGGAEGMSPDPVVEIDEDEDLLDNGELLALDEPAPLDVDLHDDDAEDDDDDAEDDDDDEKDDEDDEDRPSYYRSTAGPLFGGQTVADDLARRGRDAPVGTLDNDDDSDHRDQPTASRSGRMAGFARGAWIVGQCIIAVLFGAGLFVAFDQLWKWNNIVALVLSVLVILGLVVGVRVVRKTEDIGSTLIAVAVGALVTLGPLALLQSG